MKRVFKQFSSRLSLLAMGSAVVLAGSALAFTQKSKPEAFQAPPVDERPLARESDSHSSFSPVVKKVAPGVVKIVTTIKGQKTGLNGGPGEMDDLFRRFFGEQFQGRSQQRREAIPRQQGLGSGVVVTKDGYILTNNHVVDGADEVKVTLQDGREFVAKVIGRDPKTDIAVVKVDASELPAVPMADSDKLEVGDVVLAIGNPFGLGQTVTSGIISATGRSGTLGLDYEDFIQTDAAINPGNSGGALVDAEGRLIGINTAILSRSGGNQGIGFAVPVSLARDVMQNLITDGHVTRGFLGVMIQDINPALAKQFKIKDDKGALVSDVTPKSPAEKAGVESGDVLVEFNGKKVLDSRHLKLEVARTAPGKSVTLKVLRDGEPKTFTVAVKELPGTEHAASKEQPAAEDSGSLNGVGVGDLDRQARQQFEIPESVRGAIVTQVEPESPSAEAGLKAGDVIQEINRHPVRNAEEAVRLSEKPADKATLLRIWRSGASHFLVVDETKTK